MLKGKQLLVADLISPHTEISCELFCCALKSFVEWKFGVDAKATFKWGYLLPSSQFLVFFDNDNITKALDAEASIELKLENAQVDSNCSLVVKFSLVTSTSLIAPEYLLLSCSDSMLLELPCDIQASLKREHSIFVPPLLFTRCGSIIVKMPPQLPSQAVAASLASLPGVLACTPLLPSGYCFLEAAWQSSKHASPRSSKTSSGELKSVMSHLVRRGDSLLGLIRSILSLYEEQPCLIDIAPVENEEKIIFVCATTTDAVVLLQHDGGRLSMSSLGGFIFSTEISTKRSTVMESDIDLGEHQPQLRGGSNAQHQDWERKEYLAYAEVLNFDLLIGLMRHKFREKSASTSSTEHNILDTQIKMLSILSEIHCGLNSDPFFAIADEDGIAEADPLDLHTVTKNVVMGLYPKPHLFAKDVRKVWQYVQDTSPKESDMYVNSYQFSTFFEEQYLMFGAEEPGEVDVPGEDRSDTSVPVTLSQVAVPTDDSGYEEEDESDSFASMFSKRIDKGREQEGRIITGPPAEAWVGRAAKNQKGDWSSREDEVVLPKDNGISLTREGRYSKTIRIARFSMAQYLSLMLRWKEHCEGTGAVAMGQSGEAGGPVQEMLAVLEAHDCSVEVLIDKYKRKQKVILYGASVASVRRLSLAVCDVISLLTKNRKVCHLSENWGAEHREAIMGSLPLQEKICSLHVAVVFHFTDGHVVVEMVSSSNSAMKKMKKFLQSLSPTNVLWEFPLKNPGLSPPRLQFWNELRYNFAVLVSDNIESRQYGTKVMKIQAVGFKGDEFISGAYDILSQVADGREKSINLRRDNDPDENVQRQQRGAIHGPEEAQKKGVGTSSSYASSGPSPVIAVYKFKAKDRHASHFFSSYEKMFQRFFLKKHNVSITCFCTTEPSVSSTTKCTGDVPHGNRPADSKSGEGGLCMLDMRGGSPAGMNAVKHYLSHMMERLAVQQVLFEQVSSQQYERIVQAKQHGIQAFFGQAYGAKEGALDPLAHGELLSLRMEPPLLHVHGAREGVSFPVDVVVFVCSPTATSSNGGHQHSNKGKMLMDTFRQLKRDILANFGSSRQISAGKDEELKDLERVRQFYQQALPARPCEGNSLGPVGTVPGTLQKKDQEQERDWRPRNFAQSPGLMSSPSMRSMSTMGEESMSSLFSQSTATSSGPSYFQPVGHINAKEGTIGMKLPPSVPFQEATEWRNTFSVLNLGLSARQLGSVNDGNQVWPREGGAQREGVLEMAADGEHSLLSDDLSLFSPNSFPTFLSPLSMHSAGHPPPLSPLYHHVGEEGRERIIEGINGIIDEEKSSFTANEKREKETSSLAASEAWSVAGPSSVPGRAATPLSYTEALLTPSSHVAAVTARAPSPPMRSAKDSAAESVYQRTVHWPHPSFRYMFLADHMKQRIQTTIQAVEFKDTVQETQTVQLVLNQSQFEKLSGDALSTVKNIQGEAGVHIILSGASAASASSGMVGAGLSPRDIPHVTLDWRQKVFQSPAELSHIFAPDGVDATLHSQQEVCDLYRPDYRSRSGGGAGRDTIAVQIPSACISPTLPRSHTLSPRPAGVSVEVGDAACHGTTAADAGAACAKTYVEIAVQYNGGEGNGWVWGSTVNSLFAVVDINSAESLSEEEKKMMAYGDILLTRDVRQGEQSTVILRAQAAPPSAENSPVTAEAAVRQLQSLVTRAIRQADSISLSGGAVECTGLVVVPPVSLPFFTEHFAQHDIEDLCLRAIVDYVQTHQVFSLQRIVCLEVMSVSEHQEPPLHASPLAASLFLLVKGEHERKTQLGSSNVPFVSACHNPLVLDSLVKHIRLQEEERERQEKLKLKQLKLKLQKTTSKLFSSEVPDARRRGTHVVLLRGTAKCLLASLKLIMAHVAPPESRKVHTRFATEEN